MSWKSGLLSTELAAESATAHLFLWQDSGGSSSHGAVLGRGWVHPGKMLGSSKWQDYGAGPGAQVKIRLGTGTPAAWCRQGCKPQAEVTCGTKAQGGVPGQAIKVFWCSLLPPHPSGCASLSHGARLRTLKPAVEKELHVPWRVPEG